MKNRPVVMFLLFSLAAAGCQGNPQVRRVVDSYNAEARQMEDMIYLLEQDIQVLEQENSQLKRQIERGGGASGSSGTRGGGLCETPRPAGERGLSLREWLIRVNPWEDAQCRSRRLASELPLV